MITESGLFKRLLALGLALGLLGAACAPPANPLATSAADSGAGSTAGQPASEAGSGEAATDEALTPAPFAGRPAPNFTLKTTDGKTIDLAGLRGRPVVINFWATWCGPCRTEMPDLQAFYDDHRPQGLELIGVNIQESPEDVTQYRQMHGISFPPVLDSDGSVTREYLVRGVPSTFFIDPQGTIRQVQIGPLNRKGLNEKLARTLESDA